ncbi:MAG TPA: GNAT family N-acetyltransferase [Candidatus Limnocylindria bacterium]|jgi:ribosomal protein S18 acetylase RimI-like enzyme|nr:GNAT family N-acetyltransferase [Candidatus Limnocylindria bacterium]
MAALPAAQLRAREVTDRDEIAAYLRTDRRYAAYALGDLDSAARGRCSWGIAYDGDDEPVALAMHHDGLVPQPLFLMGEPAGVRAVLASVIKPRDAFFQSTKALDLAASDLYELEDATVLLRMVVDGETFIPAAGTAQRLNAADIDDLNRLYQLGFRAGFAQAILDDAVYYGIRIRGRLVSAAGTHVINRREGIAVVGNVMTHADYRGHGFAQMVTSAVTASLLEEVPDVALNVHADNGPAVTAYARLGYREYCRLTERLGRRRSGGWGLMRPIREAMRITWPRDQR